jgi:GT2 family glycosyltransferase/glycosyltransferase involved in cell wall biosynthesis
MTGHATLLGEPDRHLEGLLALAADHAAGERYAEALRHADRARRLDPENPVLADLCARLLLRLGRPAEALSALDRAAGYRPCAPSLTRPQALLALGDAGEAARELGDLFLCYAADTVEGLPEFADALCRSDRVAAPGWVGVASDGAVVGALNGDLARFRWALGPAERQATSGRLPPGIMGARALAVAPSWRLEGRVRRRGDTLSGSATFGWAPHAPVTVAITDAAGREQRVVTAPRPVPSQGTRQVFRLRIEGEAADGALTVEALTPDGGRLPLVGSPLSAPGEVAPRLARRPVRPPPAEPEAPPARLSVIVPAYAGLADTLACLSSVLATTDRDEVEVIVVDDASPDPALKTALGDLAAAGQITLLANPRNLGFPGSVNRGMALRPDRDVVLLNADAEVFGDWLARLRRAAYAAPDIATATPFSNSGSLMAYPKDDDAGVDTHDAADLDERLSRLNPGRLVDLPSGSGFCLYIKRACLTETGPFEETAFGRGYGEEDDFCQRARALGWRHVGAADVFVRHAGGRSFGPLKALLTAANLKRLYARHPAYRRAIRRFLLADPLRALRRALDEDRLMGRSAPSVLLVTLSRGGGVERHVRERAHALRAEGLRVIELRPAEGTEGPGACDLVVAGAPAGDLDYKLPDDLGALATLLGAAEVERVEIHHLLGLDPAVLDLPRRLNAPYDVVVHDYSWICPRITLTAGRRYCGEPRVETCERCVAEHGGETGEDIAVAALRARSAAALAGAARVIAPTRDVADRLARYFPDLEIMVTPWEPARPAPAVLPRPPRKGGERMRVAVLGAIGEHKGYDRLLACAHDAAARGLPLEYVVIGYTEDDATLFRTGRVFVTGRFEEGEAAALLEREACDAALLPSIWPETWCYALTPILDRGLPVVAFDIGAMAERLGGGGRARLLPLETAASALNDALLAAAAGPVVAVRGARQDAHDFSGEAWARLPGANAWIEGFRVELDDVRCSAILAGGEQTAWTSADWCADPAGARPLVGFALGLRGDLALTHTCAYDGVFSSGAMARAADGAPCQSPFPNDPLVAIRLTLCRVDPPRGPG